MNWCDGNTACFLEVLSPTLVIAGIGYQSFRLFRLRKRQKAAVEHICDEIAALPADDQSAGLDQLVAKIELLMEHYKLAVFGGKTPDGLLDEWIEMASIVATLERYILSSGEYLSGQERKTLMALKKNAVLLRRRARLVLFTL